MHILAVDPPTVSRFSGDSFVSGSSWHSVLTSAVPIVGSSFIDCSRLSGSFDTWTFDSYFTYPLGSSPLLGIGDTIAVYRQAFDLSVSLGAHSSAPAFMGRLTHIVGWGPTLVEFGVDIESIWAFPPTTIQIPLSFCRLSLFQRLWGWLCPWPRCSSCKVGSAV